MPERNISFHEPEAASKLVDCCKTPFSICLVVTRKPIRLTDSEEAAIFDLLDSSGTTEKVKLRLDIILSLAQRKTVRKIVQELHTSQPTVFKWGQRFKEQRVEGLLEDAPRCGRDPKLTPEQEAEVVQIARTDLANAPTPTTRNVAQQQQFKVSASTIQRRWRQNGVVPPSRLATSFLTKADFLVKLLDIVAVYLCPPDRCLAVLLLGPAWRKPNVFSDLERRSKAIDFRYLDRCCALVAGRGNPFSAYIWSRLSPSLQRQLSRMCGPSEQMKLAAELSQVIQGESIYSASRFEGVRLREITKSLLVRHDQCQSLLNRLLLEDAWGSSFPPLRDVPELKERPSHWQEELRSRLLHPMQDSEKALKSGLSKAERELSLLKFLGRLSRWSENGVQWDGVFSPLVFERDDSGQRTPAIPGAFKIHLLCCDSDSIHVKKVQRWVQSQPDFTLDIISSGDRWLKAVEHFFRAIDEAEFVPRTFDMANSLINGSWAYNHFEPRHYDTTEDWNVRTRQPLED